MAALKTQGKGHSTGAILAAVFFLTILATGLAGTALAEERYVLDYDDTHIRSHRGQPATLYLKKTLREQYPGVEINDLELRRVVLIAKSRQGRGDARLQVGHRETGSYPVDSGFGRFRDDRRSTFDRVEFDNPSRDSDGPWQIDLWGNFIVNKVVLVVDHRPRGHRLPPGWHHSEWHRF